MAAFHGAVVNNSPSAYLAQDRFRLTLAVIDPSVMKDTGQVCTRTIIDRSLSNIAQTLSSRLLVGLS